MAAGIPVVASNAGGIQEIISSPETGHLVEDGDPHKYTSEIMKIYNMSDKGKKIGMAAKAAIHKTFSKEVIMPKLENSYLELIHSGEK